MDRSVFASLAPGDAVVALRSFPRRYAGSFRSEERSENEPGEQAMVDRVGSDGVSARHLVIDTTRSLELLATALKDVVLGDDATLAAAVADRSARSWPSATRPVDDDLAELSTAATAMADQVDSVRRDAWDREASVEGSSERFSALDVLREAMATATGNLNDLERLLDEVR